MAKSELAWICGIVPKATNQRIVALCKELNVSVGLPETVFRFPLHISMKKSFQTVDFEKVREDLSVLVKAHGPLECVTGKLVVHRNMIWLPVQKTAPITALHNAIDQLLLEKYGIPLDRFDRDFNPHVSLFTSGKPEQIQEMFSLLREEPEGLESLRMTINRFVIGASGHRDVFYEV